MKLYVLTCINEDYKTVDTQIFERHEFSYGAMKERYEKELKAITSHEENNVFDNSLDYSNAHIYWMTQDGAIYVYEFNVSQVEFNPEPEDHE